MPYDQNRLNHISLAILDKFGKPGNPVYDENNGCNSVCMSLENSENSDKPIWIYISLTRGKIVHIVINECTYYKMTDGSYKDGHEDIFVPGALSKKLEKVATNVLTDPTKHDCSSNPFCLSTIASKQ